MSLRKLQLAVGKIAVTASVAFLICIPFVPMIADKLVSLSATCLLLGCIVFITAERPNS